MDTLDKHFRELTRAAFARYGFSYAEVIARWPEIVGGALAQHSRPQRIKWPRGSGVDAQKLGGTLVISAAPGRALDLQYEVPRIIERINAFYGFCAIAAVKVMTQPKAFAASQNPRPAPAESFSDPVLEMISDENLRAALQRLGAAVAGASTSSPQGK